MNLCGRPLLGWGLRLLVPLFVLLLLAGCGGNRREDPILRLSAEESLSQGTALMAEKKYRQAKKYLIHAFEVEPNSVSGRDGLLLAADALFLAGGQENLIEAETRYRDFLNRFPTSDRAAYAQLRIGESLSRRMEKPNRDQKTTAKAVEELEDLIRLYPTSNEAREAQTTLVEVKNNLAEHEYVVAAFYMRFGCRGKRPGLCTAVASRLEHLLTEYPAYEDKGKVYELLCQAHSFMEAPPEGATDACGVLRADYPNAKIRQSKKARRGESPRRKGKRGGEDEKTESAAADDEKESGK